MNAQRRGERDVTLTVRWFSSDRGYGFGVEESAPEKDVLITEGVFQNGAFPLPGKGAQVTGRVREGRRGARLVSVANVKLCEFEPTQLSLLEGIEIEALPVRPARVRWFDTTRHYGFVSVFGKASDAFLHADILRASGMEPPKPGEAVAVRISTDTGREVVVQVLPWLHSARSSGPRAD